MAHKFSPDLYSATKEHIFYTLVMFPYPSGVGLHVGHASNYTINDVLARYQRHKGKTVFNPIGFDSFGLPTENFAMKIGKPAYEVTEENIAYFLKQIEALNMSFDMDRVLATSRPNYYKWTQWIFIQLFKAGLVYRDELRVNWCPECQTVLANDQVIDGCCERCKSEIIQKKMPQWFIKITAYADRLLEDLDIVDRPEETKTAQRHWIGRSEGAEIDFIVDQTFSTNDHESEGSESLKITVFTTRPDTIYGVTALVLAPENTIIDKFLEGPYTYSVEEYRKQTMTKTTVQRQQDSKFKTGVFSGVYATHPLDGNQVPIWYADYVLPDYATGSIMLVPGHDERDYEFATKYDIPIVQVIRAADDELVDEIYTGTGTLINSGPYNGLLSEEAKNEIVNALQKIGRGTSKITYKLRDWSVSRQRYRGSPIPIYYDHNNTPQVIPDDQLPVILPLDIANYKPKGKSPLAEHPTFPIVEIDGNEYQRECDTLDTFMCSSFYFLRYIDSNNPDQLADPSLLQKMFPVDFYIGGKEHTVGHLLYSRFIHKFLYDQGYVAVPEPFQKLVHQGMVLGADGRKMSKRWGNVIDPLEIIEMYGADTLRVYLMFMGPVEQDKIWNDNSLKGVHKFLSKVGLLLSDDFLTEAQVEANESMLHKTIKGITDDFERVKLNTVISKLMIFVNHVYGTGAISISQLRILAVLLHPYAPQLAEKIWCETASEGDIDTVSWPEYDVHKILEEQIDLPVQINGKMRGSLKIDAGQDERTVMELAQQVENIAKYLHEKTIKKVIYVPDKILNIVVG